MKRRNPWFAISLGLLVVVMAGCSLQRKTSRFGYVAPTPGQGCNCHTCQHNATNPLPHQLAADSGSSSRNQAAGSSSRVPAAGSSSTQQTIGSASRQPVIAAPAVIANTAPEVDLESSRVMDGEHEVMFDADGKRILVDSRGFIVNSDQVNVATDVVEGAADAVDVTVEKAAGSSSKFGSSSKKFGSSSKKLGSSTKASGSSSKTSGSSSKKFGSSSKNSGSSSKDRDITFPQSSDWQFARSPQTALPTDGEYSASSEQLPSSFYQPHPTREPYQLSDVAPTRSPDLIAPPKPSSLPTAVASQSGNFGSQGSGSGNSFAASPQVGGLPPASPPKLQGTGTSARRSNPTVQRSNPVADKSFIPSGSSSLQR